MKDNRPPEGNLALPEFSSIDLVFHTLRDRCTMRGEPCMASFIVDSEIMGVMVLGKTHEVAMLSRLLMTIGQSPLVKMGQN